MPKLPFGGRVSARAKKIISVVAATAVTLGVVAGVFTLLPLRTTAAVGYIEIGTTRYGPSEAKQFSEIATDFPGTLSYTEGTSLLEMTDYTGASIAINATTGDSVKITIKGTNTINPTATHGLKLGGGGTLTLGAGAAGASLTIAGVAEADTIAVDVSGKLTVDGDVTLTATGSAKTSDGVTYAAGATGIGVTGDFTVSNGAKVIATGGAGSADGNDIGAHGGTGAHITGNVTLVQGASLEATGGAGQNQLTDNGEPGLLLDSNSHPTLSVQNSALKATGGAVAGWHPSETPHRIYTAGHGVEMAHYATIEVTGTSTVTATGGAGNGNGNHGGHGIYLPAGVFNATGGTVQATGGAGSQGTTHTTQNPDGLGGTGGTGIFCADNGLSTGATFTVSAATVTAIGGVGGQGTLTSGNGGDGIRATTPVIQSQAIVTATGGAGGAAGNQGGTGGAGITFTAAAPLVIQSAAEVEANGGAAANVRGGNGIQHESGTGAVNVTGATVKAKGGTGSVGGAGIGNVSRFAAADSADVTATGADAPTGGAGIQLTANDSTFIAEGAASVDTFGGKGDAASNPANGGHGLHFSGSGGTYSVKGRANHTTTGGAGGAGENRGRGTGGDGIFLKGPAGGLTVEDAKLYATGGNGTGGGSISPTNPILEGGSGIRTGATTTLTISGEFADVNATGGEAGSSDASTGGFGMIIGGNITCQNGAVVNAQGGHTYSVGSTGGTRAGDGILTYASLHITGKAASQPTTVTGKGGDARQTNPTATVTGGYGLYAAGSLTVDEGATATGTGGAGGTAGPGGSGTGSGAGTRVATGARLTATGGSATGARSGRGLVAGISDDTANLQVNSGRLIATAGSGTGEGIAVLSAAAPQVSGGTSVLSGSIKHPQDEANTGFTITGGSWHIRTPGQPAQHTATNGTSRVYCVTIQLGNLGEGHAISGIRLETASGTAITDYGLDDVYTDADGKVYLWLPEGAKVLGITTGGTEYLPRNQNPVSANTNSDAAGTYWPLSDSSGSASTSASGSTSGSVSGSTSGSASGSTSGSASGSTSGSTSGSATSSTTGAPQTGDAAQPLLWFALSCAALAALGMLYILRKKITR